MAIACSTGSPFDEEDVRGDQRGVRAERPHRGHPLRPGTQVAIYLTRKRTDLSLKEIGAFWGDRHYTAVSVAFRRIEATRPRDLRLDREFRKITRDI